MEIGNLVKGIGRRTLVCGSGTYDCAVVVSINPFILISESADMRWNNVEANEVKVIGQASSRTLYDCMSKRLDKEERPKDFKMLKSLVAAQKSYTVFNDAIKAIESLTHKLIDRKIDFIQLGIFHKPTYADRAFNDWDCVSSRYIGYINAISSITEAMKHDEIQIKNGLSLELIEDNCEVLDEKHKELFTDFYINYNKK